MEALDVYVVGSSNVDMCTYTPRMPSPGETICGTNFEQGFGGKGANQAIAASLLGSRVGILTKVGEDDMGKQTIRNYQTNGVDISDVLITNATSTGVAAITIDESGENCIVIVPGANNLLTPSDVETRLSHILCAEVVTLQLEIPDETVLASLNAISTSNTNIGKRPLSILNPAPARDISAHISLCDILVPNETEAELLTGHSVKTTHDVEIAARKLANLGAKVVLITRGAEGVFVLAQMQPRDHLSDGPEDIWYKQEFVPATSVDKVVDTVGAGDAFVGAFAHFIAHRRKLQGNYSNVDNDDTMLTTVGVSFRELVQVAEKASCVAAWSVQRRGTQKSYPQASELPPSLQT